MDGAGVGAINHLGVSATAIVPDNADNGDDDALANFVEEWEETQGALKLQVGANDQEGVDNIEAIISGVSSGALDMTAVSVASNSAATCSIGRYDAAIESVSSKRSSIGSFTNWLSRQHSI